MFIVLSVVGSEFMFGLLTHGKVIVNIRHITNKSFLNGFFMLNYLRKVKC